MHKKLFQLCLIMLTFFLTACVSATATTPVPMLPTTETPSPLPTHTSLPTKTLTPSITPLPTIPTFTPTFDVSTFVTMTPAPMVECPSVDPAIAPEDYLPKKLEYPSPIVADKILEFLNDGGNGQSLTERLDQIYSKVEYSGGYALLDVTGDQVSEFLYVELSYTERPIALSCKDGKYKIIDILSGPRDFDFYEMKFGDLNADAIPEIIITGTGGVSFPISTMYAYEWNGRTFSILGEQEILALRQIEIKDIDLNGTNELILTGDNPGCLSCSNFVPQRQRTVIYSWNGNALVEISNEFELPEYRFQAIQDADALAVAGKYDRAIQLYEEAISNMRLEWWSPERMEYMQALYLNWIPDLPLPPEPLEDKTEYPRLAAYAYYRIMLIDFVEGNGQEAGAEYTSLQEKFGTDNSARPYIEMTTEFWNAYQVDQNMYAGCAAAIQYAAEHPEMLIPLGSDYHGWQSHEYIPADICPFR